MSRLAETRIVLSRKNLVRASVGVIALFLMALIPGAIGKTFWVAFLIGAATLILIGAAARASAALTHPLKHTGRQPKPRSRKCSNVSIAWRP